MTIQSGRTLRQLLTRDHRVEEIVHFGVQQVFGRQATNYTCLLILDKQDRSATTVERVEALDAWRYGTPGSRTVLPVSELTDAPWQFADAQTRALFARIHAACGRTLRDVAEIFVGVQTSADSVYIFKAASESEDCVTFEWNGNLWPIERGILRPCLHDAPLFPYTRAKANAWMIFPYEIIKGSRSAARLIQPEDMQQRFPLCFAYLTARRTELEQRNIAGGSVADSFARSTLRL